MVAGASQVVVGAGRQPFPYGLLSVLDLRPEGDRHWMNGVTWETLACGPVSGIGDPDCTPGESGETTATGLPKTFEPGVPFGEASAFGVIATFKCSPVGRSLSQAQDRAVAQLLAREENRVERALATGDLGNEPNFLGADELLGGSASDPASVLGALEQYIADNYGSAGVIHASVEAASTLTQKGLVVTNGSAARTAGNGTRVVFGGGYGTDPDGDAPSAGESWAYVTPPLFGYRSTMFTSSNRPGDLLDRGQNDLYAVAERTYLIGFDPCGVGAALLSHGCC